MAQEARFVSAARNALARYLRHYRPQLMLAGRPHARVNGPTAVDSFNWSGYADGSKTTKAGTFTQVSGSWTTPSVKCGAEDELTSEWVGLDGWTSGSLEQLGTMSWCYRGAALYFTWWEMFFPPTNTGLIRVGTTLKPGDKITASVTRSGTNYTLKLTDATTPRNGFTIKQACPTTTCRIRARSGSPSAPPSGSASRRWPTTTRSPSPTASRSLAARPGRSGASPPSTRSR